MDIFTKLNIYRNAIRHINFYFSEEKKENALPGKMMGEIIRNVHSIEKGLSLEKPRKFFGYKKIRAGEYIFGKKVKPVIKIFWVIVILIGSQSTLGFAWDLADTFNGLMIIPNLIGIIFLSNEAVKMKNDFFKKNVTFR